MLSTLKKIGMSISYTLLFLSFIKANSSVNNEHFSHKRVTGGGSVGKLDPRPLNYIIILCEVPLKINAVSTSAKA